VAWAIWLTVRMAWAGIGLRKEALGDRPHPRVARGLVRCGLKDARKAADRLRTMR